MTRELWIYDRSDGHGETVRTDKAPGEAIDEWLGDDYDTGGAEKTIVVEIVAYSVDDHGEPDEELATKTFPIDPPEPDCVELEEHDWCAPHSLLGGLGENPGVFGGHGGRITSTDVCRHCGWYRKTSSIPGERYDSVSYNVADERSLEWVQTRAETWVPGT